MYRTVQDWELFLGSQIKELRLRLNVSQGELALRAGIGVASVSRLEGGKGSSLATLVKVLQVLRQEDWLEQLAPAASVSPVQVHALGKPRQRARARAPIRPTGPAHGHTGAVPVSRAATTEASSKESAPPGTEDAPAGGGHAL
ncbi:MAG: helix-turn-helix domain-containing protein [Eggerthellaceae bacterium]|jgi:transcriptional regulator with XRE-family HTH domain|nr:helix-turn-helix domain-containing protein [Eggerthellaceae bacterium]MDR2715599.1 helix-turn-helix domain-containing protein [Coriobacteriaceae bacterium]